MSSSLKISACPLFVPLPSGTASYAQKMIVNPEVGVSGVGTRLGYKPGDWEDLGPSQMMLRAESSRHNGTCPLPARENGRADLVKGWYPMTPQVAVRF